MANLDQNVTQVLTNVALGLITAGITWVTYHLGALFHQAKTAKKITNATATYNLEQVIANDAIQALASALGPQMDKLTHQEQVSRALQLAKAFGLDHLAEDGVLRVEKIIQARLTVPK